MLNQTHYKLAEGVEIPSVGFGTYLIGNDEVADAVYTAIKAGYRHIDTAEAYRNEEGVGLGIRRAMAELGLKREDLFVTTKLWPGNPAWGHPAKDYTSTIDAFNKSLERLQLEYVDLYLTHAPFGDRLEVWRALADLKRQGKTRAIGVSNYNQSHIEELADAGLPLPDANQIELHPWSQKPELVSFLKENAITIIAYSSLVPLSTWRTAEGHDSAKTEKMKADSSAEASPFRAMAEKYGVSEAQLLLRWALEKGYAVLPKSTKEARMKQNIDLFSFEIDEQDMAAMERLDRGDGVAWSSGDPTHAT